MEKKQNKKVIFPKTSIPIIVMLAFSLVLFIVLIYRVYRADLELASERLCRTQAELAAEAGIHFTKHLLQNWLLIPENYRKIEGVTLESIGANSIKEGAWKRIGLNTDATFRIIEFRVVTPEKKYSDQNIIDTIQISIISEGKSKSYIRRAKGILALTDIGKRFVVMNSLNEFYYGQPLQPYVEVVGGLEQFVKANPTHFQEKLISYRGICFDPKLLCQMFQPEKPNPFKLAGNKELEKANYGTLFYLRHGESPAVGTIYCFTPIIIDSHTFWGPIQTASYVYRRANAQARIQMKDTAVAVLSSKRIQHILENLEGDLNTSGLVIDRDLDPHGAYVNSWRPNFFELREFARKSGIYIDSSGKATIRGEPLNVDFHLASSAMLSESYIAPVLAGYQRDEIVEDTITLSTPFKFADTNNLDASILRGVKLLFSENSIFIRGPVGGDLVIATPKHIYLTGSLNEDGTAHLFLVAGEGVGVSTHDLEDFIATRKPDYLDIEAAKEWIIKAYLYKPGSGWFSKWPVQNRLVDLKKIVPRDDIPGQKVTLRIFGGCLEGNLNRWLEIVGNKGLEIVWDKHGLDGLPIRPITVNVSRISLYP